MPLHFLILERVLIGIHYGINIENTYFLPLEAIFPHIDRLLTFHDNLGLSVSNAK